MTNGKQKSEPVLGRRGFLWSFRYAFLGISATFHTEPNMRHHFYVLTGLLMFEIAVRPNIALVALTDFAACVVVAAELLNTSVEHVCELAVGQTWHASAKAAKDAAAGAVFVCGIGSLVVGVYLVTATFPWKWNTFGHEHWTGAIVNVLLLIPICAIYVQHVRQAFAK